MKFTNKGTERIKFCLGSQHNYDFVTVRPGEVKELEDEKRALAHGLVEFEEKPEVKAVETSIGKTKVETKKIKKILRKRK